MPIVELRGKDTFVPIDEAELFPRVQSVFQQLHNYPVGASGKEKADACKGNKYNITPVRREFLSNIRAVVALRSSEDFENRICQGLVGQLNTGRYGVPFLGDNSFLPDRLERIDTAIPTRWFEQLGPASRDGMRERAARFDYHREPSRPFVNDIRPVRTDNRIQCDSSRQCMDSGRRIAMKTVQHQIRT